jgi:hypothetical protein
MAKPAELFTPRPEVLFWVAELRAALEIKNSFDDAGFGTRFLKTAEALLSIADERQVFLIITDIKSFVAFRRKYPAEFSALKRYWVLVGEKSVQTQVSALINLGAQDVLTIPVHPVTYLNRARVLLSRFVRTYQYDDDIELPSGIRRPMNAQFEAQVVRRVELARNRGFGQQKLLAVQAAQDAFRPLPKLFSRISQPKAITSLMSEAVHKCDEVVLWTAGRAMILKKKPQEEIVSEKLVIPLSDFEHVSLKRSGGYIYVAIGLRRGYFFTYCSNSCLMNSPRRLEIPKPASFYSVQRRQGLRLAAEHAQQLVGDVLLGDRIISGMVVDWSERGLAFESAEPLKMKISKSSRAFRLNLVLNGQAYELRLEVKWRRKNRLGFLMLNGGEKLVDELHLYILERSMAYLEEYVIGPKAA